MQKYLEVIEILLIFASIKLYVYETYFDIIIVSYDICIFSGTRAYVFFRCTY